MHRIRTQPSGKYSLLWFFFGLASSSVPPIAPSPLVRLLSGRARQSTPSPTGTPGTRPPVSVAADPPAPQVDQSAARRQGGLGLGLSTCRHLVAAMGGALGLQSPVRCPGPMA